MFRCSWPAALFRQINLIVGHERSRPIKALNRDWRDGASRDVACSRL
jgi:hypothetical protein